MTRGTVKWYNAIKGYGFIAAEGGIRDVFVHATALERSGIDQLFDGQRVTFDLESDLKGRDSATNIALG